MNAIRRALLRKRGIVPRQGDWAAPRAYCAGEDARDIDWRTTARTGRLFARERERDASLTWSAVLDGSGSMHVGRRRTLYASAFEAFQLWRGLLAPHDRWVDAAQTGELSLTAALEAALQHLPSATALLAVSDVYALGTLSSSLLHAVAHRFDCTVLIARDPWHEELPLRGFVTIVDAETAQTRACYIGPQERARYRDAVLACEAQVTRVLQAAGCRAGVLEERDALTAIMRAFDIA
ncbi:MAG TPA: DUF58 domain-containing protein [Candidatus Rubrimentiphilum sp.]|nr:DUF58 domain-containing protein [Candidatus Rubrimentiphilum sp.]